MMYKAAIAGLVLLVALYISMVMCGMNWSECKREVSED